MSFILKFNIFHSLIILMPLAIILLLLPPENSAPEIVFYKPVQTTLEKETGTEPIIRLFSIREYLADPEKHYYENATLIGFLKFRAVDVGKGWTKQTYYLEDDFSNRIQLREVSDRYDETRLFQVSGNFGRASTEMVFDVFEIKEFERPVVD